MKPYPVLGDLAPAHFLRRYWQKKPLLLRSVVPEIESVFSKTALMALACREDVESRLVTRANGRWQVTPGPFRRRDLAALPRHGWSLLVQGVDSHLPQALALMQRFCFIPYARQDDLMVSVAPPGGGVGPHFDSYDVFLLQARGRRRWRLSAQSDLRLVEGAPLKILQHFSPTETFDVEPGDLLYLPPKYAHEGVARSDCITCSVGFRAPTRQEIYVAFLAWLQDNVQLEGRYADRDLVLQQHPAEISRAMIERIESMLGKFSMRRADVVNFLGEFLTEPKPHAWFTPPSRPLSFAKFAARARRQGITLALKSRMLFHRRAVFINGERFDAPPKGRSALIALADLRTLAPLPAEAEPVARMLYEWYKCGYVEFA